MEDMFNVFTVFLYFFAIPACVAGAVVHARTLAKGLNRNLAFDEGMLYFLYTLAWPAILGIYLPGKLAYKAIAHVSTVDIRMKQKLEADCHEALPGGPYRTLAAATCTHCGAETDQNVS